MVKLMKYADRDDRYVAGIIVDFQGAFDSLLWPSMLT